MDDERLRSLMSGAERGFWPGACRAVLRGAAVPYGAAVRFRNWAYDRGWKTTRRASVPVVSIGNLTAGGTGKTPFTAFVANWFRDHGCRAGIVSRGYGARRGEANDEALVLRRLCPETPHVQNADRFAAAGVAVADHQAQVVILDDGFQHRRLARDLDIVLIDAVAPWGYGHLLPRGLLREPLVALRRADLAVITRVDQATADDVREIRSRIAAIHAGLPVAEAAFPPVSLVDGTGRISALETLRGRPVAAFCGIGNPQAFRASLDRLGLCVATFRAFRDHHAYTDADITELRAWSASSGVTAVITTEKDLVKLPSALWGEPPLLAIRQGMNITRGQAELEHRLGRLGTRLPPYDPGGT